MNKTQKVVCCAAVVMFLGLPLAAKAGDIVGQEAARYFAEGVQLQKDGNLAAAEISYQKVLLISPKSYEYRKYILNNTGLIYIQNKHFDKAEQVFNEAIRLDHEYMPARLNLGLVYEQRGEKEKAFRYWMEIFDLYKKLEEMKPKYFIMSEIQTPPRVKM